VVHPVSPTRFDRGGDHFLCGTGTSERFDDRGKQSGECHRVIIVQQRLVGASSGYRAAQSNTIPKAVIPIATAAKGNMISTAAVDDFWCPIQVANSLFVHVAKDSAGWSVVSDLVALSPTRHNV
jgi:hypothetical protein